MLSSHWKYPIRGWTGVVLSIRCFSKPWRSNRIYLYGDSLLGWHILRLFFRLTYSGIQDSMLDTEPIPQHSTENFHRVKGDWQLLTDLDSDQSRWLLICDNPACTCTGMICTIQWPQFLHPMGIYVNEILLQIFFKWLTIKYISRLPQSHSTMSTSSIRYIFAEKLSIVYMRVHGWKTNRVCYIKCKSHGNSDTKMAFLVAWS